VNQYDCQLFPEFSQPILFQTCVSLHVSIVRITYIVLVQTLNHAQSINLFAWQTISYKFNIDLLLVEFFSYHMDDQPTLNIA